MDPRGFSPLPQFSGRERSGVRFRLPGLAVVLLLVTAAAACREDPRPETWWVSMHQDGVDVGVERLQPGPERPPPQAWRMREMPVQNPYEGNRRSIAEGRRLYRWMNCIDCHGEGGGSIGPTLWDDQWIYGGRPIDIFEWLCCMDPICCGFNNMSPTRWGRKNPFMQQSLFESIYYGRPDGMPAYGGHLPADQIWLLVSYVRSLEPRGGLYNEGVK